VAAQRRSDRQHSIGARYYEKSAASRRARVQG